MSKENDLLVESLLEELESQSSAAKAEISVEESIDPTVSWKASETGEALLARVKVPEKSFFRIGEVSKIVGVKPYVLRYWESEFPILKPQKSQSQQRVYRRTDVENVLLVKHLLYAERYSIEGARRRIKELKREGELASMRTQLTQDAPEAPAEVETKEIPVVTDTWSLESRERIQNLAREVVLLVHSFEERVLSRS